MPWQDRALADFLRGEEWLEDFSLGGCTHSNPDIAESSAATLDVIAFEWGRALVGMAMP